MARKNLSKKPQDQGRFSDDLEAWLKSDSPNTIASLEAVFVEKSLAIIIILLMFLPALPLPTGGISHVFEVITALVAVGLIVGLKTPWLPKAWKQKRLSKTVEDKAIPMILNRVRWFEKRSMPRIQWLVHGKGAAQLLGLLILGFTVAAFFAPPFSGLDTLPALGVVVIALGIILEDGLFVIAGTIIGLLGIGVIVGIGAAIVTAINSLF